MSKAPTAKRVAISIPEKRAPAPADAFVTAGREQLLPPEEPRQAAPAAAAEPTKRLTIDIPESLHKRLRMHAATDGQRLANIVRDLLDEHLPKP